jgi:hypothetical protein
MVEASAVIAELRSEAPRVTVRMIGHDVLYPFVTAALCDVFRRKLADEKPTKH